MNTPEIANIDAVLSKLLEVRYVSSFEIEPEMLGLTQSKVDFLDKKISSKSYGMFKLTKNKNLLSR